MKSQTPMMRQYLRVKAEHPGVLVFFRLGDFYEMFFEDAVLAARELEITLTSRNQDREGKPIPMCGVPHHAVDTYLSRLVRKGYRVALCEQVEDARLAKGLVNREVVRIVTPGTAIEEDILDSSRNNFLASLVIRRGRLGAAFADLSTGEFLISELSGEGRWQEAAALLAHFRPSELVLPEDDAEELSAQLPAEALADLTRTPREAWTFHSDYASRLLLEQFRVQSLAGFGVNGERTAVSAAGGLLAYLRDTQKNGLGHLLGMRYFQPRDYLALDPATVANLELERGLDGNRRWTLLAALDRTRTGMGARLLRNWLLRPSLQVREIEDRLDAVQELLGSAVAMGKLGGLLDRVRDVERLLGKVTMEKATPRDLLALAASLEVLPGLAAILDGFGSRLLEPRFDLLEDVREWIGEAVDPEAPVNPADGGVIRAGHDSALDEVRELSRSGKSFIAKLESAERERTGLAKLRVKYNRVFGYFLELPRSQSGEVPDDYVRKQTLVNCERYFTPELKAWEDKVLGAEEKIAALERELFSALRRRVGGEAARIQETARAVARLDVLLAFAENAQRHRYVRPAVDESTRLEIRAGRHPVLETQSEEPFVPNDLCCDTEAEQLLILTGPNMGGKSTYLRQNALIVIMAQMGSFVPAEQARVGLVDRIYTRVGASDNLARGRSTFMVEMIETANILNTATPRSLVLLDEVGRGTATFDGLSLAWSIAEYLTTEPSRRARTLFATHYQELTRLEQLYPGVRNYCVTVRESGGRIIFFHRVAPGVASKSYGIEVARLAGLPAAVLGRAREVLGRLERKELNLAGGKRPSSSREALAELQPALFS